MLPGIQQRARRDPNRPFIVKLHDRVVSPLISLFVECASPEQASNVFVERALTYVLGYLLQNGRAEARERNTLKDALLDVGTGSRALAIKLRADNDFYSQTSQARKNCTHYCCEAVRAGVWVLRPHALFALVQGGSF